MDELLPDPLVPHKSFVCILAIKPGLSGSGIGIKVSVPRPRLLSCVKFRAVNEAATPAFDKNTPSSWTLIPSLKSGVNCVQRIPPVSLVKKAPLTPDEFVESNISLSIFTLPRTSSACSGNIVPPTPTDPIPVVAL